MRIERNALESDRFGVAFARLDGPAADADLPRLLRDADDAGIDVVSTRACTDDLTTVRALEGCGFRIMDTLVYYRAALPMPQRPPAAPGPAVTAASAEDSDACAQIAAAAFHDYLGHYHADPRLDSARADAAYVDWTVRLLRDASTGRVALCARTGDAVSGFLVGMRRDEGISEIVLNAVDPAHHRQGYYAALLSAYCRAAEGRGDREVVISTQLQNYLVQRAWHRHGFMLFDSYHTLHRWRPGG